MTQRDIYLINSFSQIRLPIWVTCFPVLGIHVYLSIYKSWMIAYSKPYEFWKKFRFLLIRTGGVAVFSAFLCIFFTLIYWISLGTSNSNVPFADTIYFSVLLLVVIFYLIYQPINLYFEPKRIKKAYGTDEYMSNIDTSNDQLSPYDFQTCINNWKTCFKKLTCFTLLTADPTLREQWLQNMGIILSDDSQKVSIAKLAHLKIIQKEVVNVAGTSIPLPDKFVNLNINKWVSEYLISSWFSVWLPATVARIRGFEKGACAHLSYLSIAGIWYIGTLSTIFMIFNKKNKFSERLSYLGWSWTAFTLVVSVIAFSIPVVNSVYNFIGFDWSVIGAIILLPYGVGMSLLIHLVGILVWEIVSKKLKKIEF